MKRTTCLLAAALLALPSFTFATPVTLKNPTADFHNTNGSNATYSHSNCPGPNNGKANCETRWGTPSTKGGKTSGLRFDPFKSPLNTNTGDPFSLGTLSHFNYPINAGTAATSTQLTFSFDITTPNLGIQTFQFAFAINETPNSPPCQYTPVPSNNYCPDSIGFGNARSSTTFNIGGDEYTLWLLGFGDDANSIASQFITQENKTSKTRLWGKIDLYTPRTSVPEPDSLLMLALGLLGVAGAVALRRRREGV